MTELSPDFPGQGKANRNERRKALATMLNAVSVAILISGVLQPLSSERFDVSRMILATGVFVVLQALLHYVLTRVED
jgi:protein-S-isoprenylcysteine O-methyltransferase Ste14